MKNKNKDDDYYDGTRHLNFYSSICANFNKNLDECTKQENCGWCYSSNSCIHGTKEGPVDKCLPRHFVYKGNQI